eukprot:ANDGO_05190.mRNA.1 Protein PNS1
MAAYGSNPYEQRGSYQASAAPSNANPYAQPAAAPTYYAQPSAPSSQTTYAQPAPYNNAYQQPQSANPYAQPAATAPQNAAYYYQPQAPQAHQQQPYQQAHQQPPPPPLSQQQQPPHQQNYGKQQPYQYGQGAAASAAPVYAPVVAGAGIAAAGSAADGDSGFPAEQEYTAKVLEPGTRMPWLDWWAAVLWVIQLIVVIALAIVNIKNADKKDSNEKNQQNTKNDMTGAQRNDFLLVIFVCGFLLAALLSFMWLRLMRTHALQTIWVSMFAMLALLTIYVLVLFATANYVGAFISLFFLAIFALMFYLMRKKIPFAAALLEESSILVRKFPGTIGASVAGLFLQLGWIVLISFAILSATRTNNLLILILFVFSFYWTIQVIKNVVHCSAVHTFGCWYYLTGSERGVPANSTLRGFGRACTKLLGAISMGSAIVAAIQTLRWLVRYARNSVQNILGNSLRLQIFFCMLDCIIGCIEGLARMFNMYAYVQCVVYGKPFVRAAKDTWELFESRGIHALASNNFVGVALTIAGLGIGLLCGICGALWVYYASKTPDYWWVALIICLIVGITVMFMVSQTVMSALTTIFVCWAEQPEVMQVLNPEFHEDLQCALAGNYESIAQRRTRRKHDSLVV